MNLIDTPNLRIRLPPQGRVSTTIGKIAAGLQADNGPIVPSSWHRSNRPYPPIFLTRGEVKRDFFSDFRYFPPLPFGLRGGPRLWKDCFPRLTSGRPLDRFSANHPTD